MSGCCGGKSKTLITACSGASDVGFISDRAARMLSVAGKGSMYCLAAIGAQLPGYLKGAKEAGKVVVIDGCPVKCGKIIMDNNRIACDSFVITELGYKKGKTGMSDEIAQEAFKKLSVLIETGEAVEGQNSRPAGGCSCGGKC